MKTQNQTPESHAIAFQNDAEIDALVSALEVKWTQRKRPAKRSRK